MLPVRLPDAAAPVTSSPAVVRDPRLDFFRGVALVCIVIDHMPGNRLADVTIRNLGFSDASELFVLISACTAGLVYLPRVERHGLAPVARRVWARAAQVYVSHLALMASVTIAAGWLSRTLRDRQYVQGLNVGPLLADPFGVAPRALALQFQPTFMDILPLYVVLLVALPALLPILARRPALTLAGSIALYLAARVLPTVWDTLASQSVWAFSPPAWQLLFVCGVLAGRRAARAGVPRSRFLLVASALYAAGACWVGAAAYGFDGQGVAAPDWLRAIFFPVMDRPGLSPFRLANILALAYLAWYTLPAGLGAWRWPVSRVLILCGCCPLTLFCAGVMISIAGWVAFAEYGTAPPMQAAVNASALALLGALAWGLSRLSGQRA